MANLQTFGIDISSNSGDIDWTKVAANLRPRFLFVRAYHMEEAQDPAHSYPDARFDEYWSGAAALHIPRGAYIRCNPKVDATLMVNKLFGVYKPKVGDLVPTLDIEDEYDDDCHVPVPQRIAQIQTMVDQVSAKIGGKKPIIYTKKRVWKDLHDTSQFASCPLWVMNYNTMPVPATMPGGWPTFAFWQYADSIKDVKAYGIEGDYDPDLFNGPEADLAQYCITHVA